LMKKQYSRSLMSLPHKKIPRNRRFPFLKSMIPIRITRRFTWIQFQIQSLSEKAIGRVLVGFVTPSRMQQVTQLLEEPSEKVREPRDILGTRP